MKNQISIDQQKGMFTRCKKCKGYGYHIKNTESKYYYPSPEEFYNSLKQMQKWKVECNTCKGSGRLDWVERITRQ